MSRFHFYNKSNKDIDKIENKKDDYLPWLA